MMSASQQSVIPFNQRPTQFISSLQPPQAASAHSRGGLIMPANNQIQAGNFHLAAEPASVRSQYNQMNQHQHQHQHQLLSASLSANDYLTNDNQILTHPDKEFSQKSLSGGSNNSTQMDHSHSNNNNLMGASLQSDLELALRQANGDESVFQPSSAMPVLGHTGYNQWSYTHLSNHQSTSRAANTSRPDQQQQDSKTKSDAVTQSTTESTLGAQTLLNESANKQQDPDREPATASSHLQSELNSIQSLHETPALAGSNGPDYYFSSAERAPSSNERASSNVWW